MINLLTWFHDFCVTLINYVHMLTTKVPGSGGLPVLEQWGWSGLLAIFLYFQLLQTYCSKPNDPPDLVSIAPNSGILPVPVSIASKQVFLHILGALCPNVSTAPNPESITPDHGFPNVTWVEVVVSCSLVLVMFRSPE